MPQATKRTGRSLAHVLFLSAALSLLSALVRRERRQLVLTARDRRKKVRVAPRRIAASLAFATLFFAGAALSAGAGNGVVQLIDPTSESAAATRHDHRPRRRRRPPSAIRRIRRPSRRPTSSQSSWAAARRSRPRPQPGRAGGVERPSQTRASVQPSRSRLTSTASNTNAAGVRSALRARLHAGLRKPGVAVDRARAAGQRPDGPRPSPSPAGSARDQGDEGSLRSARRSSASPRRTSRTWPPPSGCTATYRIRRRPRAV